MEMEVKGRTYDLRLMAAGMLESKRTNVIAFALGVLSLVVSGISLFVALLGK